MSHFRRKSKGLGSDEVISNISFSVFTPDEIKKLAVKRIVTPLTFDPLGHPIPGGLYDKSMGPMNARSDPCGTCLKLISECPGHFGYIELPLPAINPIFHHLIGKVLKMSCLNCCTIQIPALIKSALALQIRALDCGMVVEASEIENIKIGIAEKYAKHESIPEKTQEILDQLDKLCKEIEEKPGFQVNVTQHSEKLRVQFLSNISTFAKTNGQCDSCKEVLHRVKYQRYRITIACKIKKTEKEHVKELTTKFVNPHESRNYMRGLWKNESKMLMVLAPVLKEVKDRENPTDIFFFEVLPVPPPMTRPANIVKGKMNEHPRSNAYRRILQSNLILNTIIHVMKQEGESTDDLSDEARDVYITTRGKTAVEKLNYIWESLQYSIDAILDRDTSKQNEFLGLKQIIEKKQGLLRMHMMGKRVNFSARSVITPDPNLKIEEIGIPDTFAKKLTYPAYVNPHNIKELRQMVMNGPNVHPGANMVEFKNGKVVRLDPNNAVQRESVAKQLMTPDEVKGRDFSEQKIVHRHLCNGDILLVNRQPSLHKPSVMAHKARILSGDRTFRLHYANCKAYNADFDGDEMNVHFPQTERARSEAYNILNVSNQYLVPKDGTPLTGLIQDHVISGVELSMRGRFFRKMDYDHLVFQGLHEKAIKVKVLPATILKPKRLWSGKQVLSTIIMNIIPDGKPLLNLKSTSKIKPKDWQNGRPRPWQAGGTPFENDLVMSESEVIIKNGELLSGVLDKSHYGATPFGLIHCIYELYGGSCASEMLSALTRVFTAFLQLEGFTLGIRDLLVETKAEKKRKKIIRNLRDAGPDIMRKALNLPSDASLDQIVDLHFRNLVNKPNYSAMIDREYKSYNNNFINEMNSVCMSGLVVKFPENNLQLMVTSGAKGQSVNTMQMSCCLGQIELEGKRPPLMMSGKTLPCFPVFDFSPRSGGLIDGRFLTGIQPPEFFFHCMAGREGLIDTAVKTSRSGYLQRCLVKNLEGLHVKPDLTVRDSDNTVVQFLYGHDGMDVGKSQFLQKKHLDFLKDNVHVILDKKLAKQESKSAMKLGVNEHAFKLKEWRNDNGSTLSKQKANPFTLFTEFFNETSERKIPKEHMVALWNETSEEVKQSFFDKCQPCPDTLNSLFLPHCHFGSINERIEDLIEKYDGCKSQKEKKRFEDMLKQKAMSSLCDSGEAVGLLAAQSIGEPSTQMTLNTFHFAGRGEMNVTLGIPRLREILMTASKNIKTPSMVVPFRPIDNLEGESEALRRKFNKVTVANVLEECEFEIQKDRKGKYTYSLKFIFLPHRQYMKDYCVNPKYIMKHMKKKFFKLLFRVIEKHNKFVGRIEMDEAKTNKKSKDLDDEDNDEEGIQEKGGPTEMDDSSDEEPEDTDDAKASRKFQEVHDEDDNDDAEADGVEDVDMEDEPNSGDEGDKTILDKSKTDDSEEKLLEKYKNVDSITCDEVKHRWCHVVFSMPYIHNNFDITSVVKEVTAHSVIWEVRGISKCITYLEDGVMHLRTDGINMKEICKNGRILELNKLYVNDVHEMMKNFGADAGHDVIVKELEDVFEVYGIRIDPRHLSLIADYMTTKGTFEPLNRKGMQSSAAPFQQMSFEASLQFLKEAVIFGKTDRFQNPSSALMIGAMSEIGTGGIDVKQKICL